MSRAPGANPTNAVFLSYAREDADAARLLAETLRAGGVTVWFDENELRGGDVWDRAIRNQIRDCALFVPLISARTQERVEGYFRLEWKLAEDRSYLMAKDRPFIVPVCVDETSEREALVPDAFLTVQWTRLAGGHATPPFVERMRRLLAGGSAPGFAYPKNSRDSAAPAVPASRSEAEPRIPDFELLRKIGQGSYGDVWLARGLTGAYRAVKIVWRNRFGNAEPFEREFRGLKEFNAQSFGASQMALLHVGKDEVAGFFYYVMELADDAAGGLPLDPARYVPLTAKELKSRRGRLPSTECLTFAVELARSLAGLHARSLLHRDIKPSNVIVVGGVPKLADIGLVAPNNEARTFVGTEGYVPPEGPGAPSADVYALGMVLYELATGQDRAQFPKLPDNLGEPAEQRAFFKFNEVLLRACDTVPARRYRDAAAMLVDLEGLQAGRSVPRPRRGLYAALAAVLVLGSVGAFFALRPAKPEAPKIAVAPAPAAAPTAAVAAAAEIAKPRGIAVLPFENLDAADQAYFSAGITEEVTQHLSKINALRVMSRAAVARFAGGAADLPAMTRELAIGAILTGTVRRAGDRLRIAVQLLAAPSGETLWSEQYDREAKDVFAVQTEVAVRVAQAMKSSLSPDERGRIQRPPTSNVAAYELFLKPAKSQAEKIEQLQQAIALDAKFELAHSVLSRIYLGRAQTTGREDLDRALTEARTAVAIDAQSSRAQWALGNALSALGKIDEGRLAMQRSVELNPSNGTALNDLSVLEGNAGRQEQSFYWAKRAFPLAPNIGYYWYHVAAPLMMLDEAKAVRWMEAGIERLPDNRTGRFRLQVMLAYIDYVRGRPAVAVERLRKEAAASPRNPEVRGVLTELAVFTGAADAVERVDEALKVGPGARAGLFALTPRTLRAFLYLQAGDRERALPLIDAALAENRAAIEADDRSSWILNENAALHLMRGDRAAALEWLEGAANAGYTDAPTLRTIPIMAPLAEEPRFKQVVERIERDLRAMRARIDVSDLDELAKLGKS